MTRLINLESYLEFCQYAYLFGDDPQRLIPSARSLPLAYRDFCNKYLSRAFLPVPTIAATLPETLRSRSEKLPRQYLGKSLEDHSSGQIFVIREANSLELQSLKSRYIYANVYYYWSYAQQLQAFAASDRKVVIYNLDSFTPQQITPLTFERHPHAPYPIPIVDTRSLKQYDSLKLPQSYEDLYNQIIDHLAKKIASDLNIGNVSALSQYIKKINLLQNVEFDSSESTSLILEANDRFYRYDLKQKDLENIIYTYLPIEDLRTIINQNQDYYFVLLSSYTNLRRIKQFFQQKFQNNLYIVDMRMNNFPQIWQEKLSQSFPLFGQHLDRISFFVRNNEGQEIEIYLPEEICYEGDPEKTIYSQYEKNGQLEQNFPLKTKQVTLPFSINDERLLNNDTDIEQVYKIENQYFDQTPNLEIKIRFRLQPGLAPKLEVLDTNGRILESRLVDREQSTIIPETLGYIPMAQIIKFREQKSEKSIQILLSSNFSNDLEDFAKFLYENAAPGSAISITTIQEKVSKFRSRWSKQFKKLRILIDYRQQENLNSIYSSYSLINQVSREIIKKFVSKKLRSAHESFILILGDSYALTNDMDLDFLFNERILVRSGIMNWDKQLQTLAKIASIQKRQNLYLSLFQEYTEYRQKDFYKTDEYIWGYARLLLWYMNLNDRSWLEFFTYTFEKITCYVLEIQIDNNLNYITNALFSLIYLLTFREIDPSFIQTDSNHYNQAKRLCNRLRTAQIISRQANIDIPLNELFENLLDGLATQKQIDDMIIIDNSKDNRYDEDDRD